MTQTYVQTIKNYYRGDNIGFHENTSKEQLRSVPRAPDPSTLDNDN